MFKVKVTKNDLKKRKGPFLVIANHQSEIDFVNLVAAIPSQTHFVVGYSAYKTSSMKNIMKNIGCIPRENIDFNNDEIIQMKNILKNNMPLTIFPIGIITENGMSTNPTITMPSILKELNTDVYVAKSNGSYLTSPKWSKIRRKGHINIEIYKLLSKEQINKLSLEQLYDIMTINLRYNEYDYISNNNIYFKNGNNVEGLNYVIHQCPDCKEEYSINAHNDTLECVKCGYKAKANNKGLLTLINGSKHLEKPSDWYLWMQKELEKQVLKSDNYSFNSHGKLFIIDEETSKFKDVGLCNITLNKTNITINGNINNNHFEEILNTSSYPLIPYKPGKNIEIKTKNNTYRIVFDNPYYASKFNMLLKEFNHNKNKEAI